MKPLEPPDRFHFLAAHGWLELGNPIEAEAELERIAPELRAHPDVLKTRWAVYSKAQNWAAAADIGQTLVEMEPGDSFGWMNRSYALRRAPGGGLQAAYDALRPAADLLADLEPVAFNLACNACQLGKIEEGREWLAKSFAAADCKGRLSQAKLHALDEPDLEPLWQDLRS
jgi:tetratricopeptide (TPR) repeat protein